AGSAAPARRITTNIPARRNATMAPPFPPSAAPQSLGLSPERIAHLNAAFAAEIARKHIPGIVTLIARQGKIAHFEAQGVAHPNRGTPMKTDRIFRIYSMTKPIVSTLAMMLFEDGKFLLSDPIAQYLPEFTAPKILVEHGGKSELVPAKQPITVQDILRHT